VPKYREYVVIPGDVVEVKAENPFEAAKAIRELHPHLRERSVSVVARSLVTEHDGRRWWK
jgi:hypothetical protein